MSNRHRTFQQWKREYDKAKAHTAAKYGDGHPKDRVVDADSGKLAKAMRRARNGYEHPLHMDT